MLKTLCALALVFGTLSPRDAHAADPQPLWVYVSVYKEQIAPIEKAFEAKHPDIDVQVFQAGSEKIQAKLEAEVASHKVQADLLMISDPFWASDLEQRGLVANAGIVTNYNSLMVLIAHTGLAAAEKPKSFADLALPAFKGKVQMGSPLESGTMFATVAYLSDKFGWDYFKKLRANDIAASGGNSAVIQKVESGERKVGVVLLENALAAKKRGSPIEIIYPSEGGIPIPSAQVILKDSPHAAAALEFRKFILSKEGQRLLQSGYMYSVDPKLLPPEGAKPFAAASKGATAWTPERIKKVAAGAKATKAKFAEIVLD